MKARIPGREKKIGKYTRELIRSIIQNIALLTLIEDFEFGPRGRHGKDGRLQRFYDGMERRLQKYETLYGDDIRAMNEAIRGRCLQSKVGYGSRLGSGSKIDIAIAHDNVMLIAILTIRDDFKCGKTKMKRFFDGVERRILYYNANFDGCPEDVLKTTQNRLEQYGVQTHRNNLPPAKQKVNASQRV